tara:strand:- start:98 stop:979 length:882 start_codon:yes stop_codon:yes gene_type:complete
MVRNPNKLSLSIRNNERINLLACDIRNCKKYKKELREINYLIHTATAWGDPKRAYEVNVAAFEELLGLLKENIIEKIIYFSTASILNEETELMHESLVYGTEYIQTKYQCYENLRKSSFANKTCVLFPTLVFGGTLNRNSRYPVSYLTEGLKQAKDWLWIARFLKIDAKFHFIHARDIAQICGFLIKSSNNRDNEFKKYVLGQKFITIDEAILTLLNNYGIKRYFALKVNKTIIKFLLKVLPIQTTNWDKFSINKFNFNHKPIANPETFGLKSYAKSLKDVLKLAKLPRCNIH